MAKSSVRMEEIVRPFAAPPISPANRIGDASQEELPPAFITWGDAGPIQLPPGLSLGVDPIGDWEFPVTDWERLPEPYRSWTGRELETWLERRGLTIDDILLEVGERFGQVFSPLDFDLEAYDPNEDNGDEVLTEIARATSDVRVENPDDPSQYVIVRRIEAVTFAKASGGRLTLNFRNVG